MKHVTGIGTCSLAGNRVEKLLNTSCFVNDAKQLICYEAHNTTKNQMR